MKIKKFACLLMALAMIWMTASCHVDDDNVTELTNPPGIQQTSPTDPPETTEPDDPVPSEPDVTEPDPSEPDDSTEPSEPTDPVEPVVPSDSVVTEPGHEHEYVAVVTKATCIEVGYTTYTCDCGDVYVDDWTEATGHEWSDWATIKEPTANETGEAVSVCAMCENTQSKVIGKVIPNHTHSYSEKVTKKATCSAEGVMTLTCDCGDQYTKAIAKTSHNYSKKETWPTCYAQGYMTYTCRDCGYSYKGDYKAKVDHSYAWEDVDPTCEEQGYNLYMCDYCLTYYKADFVPALGHDYVKTVITPTTLFQLKVDISYGYGKIDIPKRKEVYQNGNAPCVSKLRRSKGRRKLRKERNAQLPSHSSCKHSSCFGSNRQERSYAD